MRSQTPISNSQSNPKSKSPKFGHWSLVIGHFSKGFSLIEAVVAVSVFAIAMTSIVGIYLSLQRLNTASASLNALQQNARFISDDIAKIVRNGSINYADYPGGVPLQDYDTVLRLLDKDGNSIRIFAQSQTLVLEKVGIGAANFSNSQVRVIDFKAFIWPPSSPFPGGNEQPRVTVLLELESNLNPRDKSRGKFQYTLTTREYPE